MCCSISMLSVSWQSRKKMCTCTMYNVRVNYSRHVQECQIIFPLHIICLVHNPAGSCVVTRCTVVRTRNLYHICSVLCTVTALCYLYKNLGTNRKHKEWISLFWRFKVFAAGDANPPGANCPPLVLTGSPRHMKIRECNHICSCNDIVLQVILR